MKTIKYFFFVVLGSVLMAADCSNKDSEFYNDVFITTPELIQIETQPSYTVNDILYINSNSFSRFTPESGQTNALDVYRTTGGATSFNFSYTLEKKISEDNWALVVLGDNLIPVKGNAQETEFYIAGLCVYNASTETYDFRYGMRLTAAGDYRIKFNYNSGNAATVELRSNSINNSLFLNINSLCSALNGGYYQFTVSE